MEHFIALTVSKDNFADDLPRLWFKTVSRGLPDGLLHTVPHGDEQIRMTRKNRDGKVVLTIPLARDLTKNEVEEIIELFDVQFKKDYSISSSKIDVTVGLETIPVEVDQKPLIDLCTAWAKQRHDQWMKDKIEAGWRYGVKVSMKNKTHPLLRQWSDLPPQYRDVDTTQIEELLKFFNEQGYLLMKKDVIERLLGNKPE